MSEKPIEQLKREPKDLPAEVTEGEKEGQREKEPKVSYHFFFYPHRTAEDVKNLEKAFEKADIYIPEVYEWTPKLKSALNKISQGEITLEEMVKEYNIEKSSSRYREFEIMRNSHKPILLVDIPKYDREFIDKIEEANLIEKEAYNLFMHGKFQPALQKLRSYILKMAPLHLAREKRIRQDLKKQTKAFIKQNPEYARKKEIKILVGMGSWHTHLYHKMRKENIPVSREFSDSLTVYPSLEEATRKIAFKKEVDDELLARALIEVHIYPWLESVTNDTNKANQSLRKISSQLTLKDMEQMSKNIAEIAQKPQIPSVLGFPTGDVVYEVEKLGINVPNSEQEMDELLKQSSK